MYKWKLIDGIEYPQKYRLYETSRTGRTRYGYHNFYPNKEYSTNDKKMIEAVKELQIKQRYSKEVEEVLKRQNIKYKQEVCRPCGGTKKYLVFNPFEEVK